jgi:hypothetical protein
MVVVEISIKKNLSSRKWKLKNGALLGSVHFSVLNSSVVEKEVNGRQW